MDRTYSIIGQDMVTGFKLDSDIYNPVYEHKEEIRDPDIPATATLVLKVRHAQEYGHPAGQTWHWTKIV